MSFEIKSALLKAIKVITCPYGPSGQVTTHLIQYWTTGVLGTIFAKPPQQEPIRDIQSQLLSSSVSLIFEEDPLIGCRYSLTLISSSQNHLYYNILEIFNFKPLYIIFKQNRSSSVTLFLILYMKCLIFAHPAC